MEEVWKDVKGFESLYQISSEGRVKSLERLISKKMFGGAVSQYLRKETILKPGYLRGYLHVSLCKDSKIKVFKVHRLVAENFIPNTFSYPQVNHKNEIKNDNRVVNLEWCNPSYNKRYSLDKTKTTSSFVGVHFNKDNGKWRVRIFTVKPILHLGYFNTEEEAINKIQEYEKQH
jgi:hypothetical protein